MNNTQKHKKEEQDHLLIKELVRSTFDPKNDKKLRHRTPLIDHIPLGGHAIIFLNKDNNHLILADSFYYRTFPIDEIKEFIITNSPEGNGNSTLSITFKSKKHEYTVFAGKLGVFDSYKEKITILSGLNVILT